MLRQFFTWTMLGVSACGAIAAAFLFYPATTYAPDPQYATLPQSAVRKLPPPPAAKLTFVGDIMLAREVEIALMENGVDWPFAQIASSWAESDLVIGNFEDTVRDAYRYEGDVLAFDTTPDLLGGLWNAGFTHLSLANNHGDDFGTEVTEYTRQTIANLGIMPFGDPSESELHIVREDVNGIALSLVGFHAFSEYPSELVGAIETENATGRFVIVYPHWGNEYQFEPSDAQVTAAQTFIDAGADLIIGAHPHVVEPIGVMEGVPVAWSLGNFIFDQDWSTATQEGLMLHVAIDTTSITIEPVPISIKNRKATIMQGDRVQQILTMIGVPDGTVTFSRQ